jgi:heme o synthase
MIALRPWLTLTKPGITSFIGMTAAAGYLAAHHAWTRPGLLAVTVLATMLMSGGAAALNHIAERHSDGRMRRTASRPVASGAVSVAGATTFAWALSGGGLLLALALLPKLAALFLVLAHVSYVFLYTPLKRRTPFCTLAGAIPGALPVLAGWAAAGKPLAVPALALTGVLFMWQIPHFLAIGWLARDDYARAGCPMLGVVDPSGGMSARVALTYAGAMFVSAAVLAATTATGALYGSATLLVGGAYIAFAWQFARHPERLPARRLFLSSLVALPLLLGSLVTDILLA